MIVREYRGQLAAVHTADWIPRSRWLYSRLDITRPWQSPSCKRRNNRGTSASDWFYSESRKAPSLTLFSLSLSDSLARVSFFLFGSPLGANHSLITSKMTYTCEATDGTELESRRRPSHRDIASNTHAANGACAIMHIDGWISGTAIDFIANCIQPCCSLSKKVLLLRVHLAVTLRTAQARRL